MSKQLCEMLNSSFLHILAVLSDSDHKPGVCVYLLPLVTPDLMLVLLLLKKQVVKVSDVRDNTDLHKGVSINLLEKEFQLFFCLMDFILPGYVLEEECMLSQVVFLCIEVIRLLFGSLCHKVNLPLHSDGETKYQECIQD
jgi:hypothetical protein